VESPGKFQQTMETIVEFVRNMDEEIIGHGSSRYTAMIGTFGIFIGLCNIIGLIPTLQTPTGHIQVTLGCAVAAFLYYNLQGFRQHGILGYLKHLCGPVMLMAIIMFPIEIVGNVGRLLSLSVRLYANMFVGDILEQVFTVLFRPCSWPCIFLFQLCRRTSSCCFRQSISAWQLRPSTRGFVAGLDVRSAGQCRAASVSPACTRGGGAPPPGGIY